jgi:hypothetical protein
MKGYRLVALCLAWRWGVLALRVNLQNTHSRIIIAANHTGTRATLLLSHYLSTQNIQLLYCTHNNSNQIMKLIFLNFYACN